MRVVIQTVAALLLSSVVFAQGTLPKRMVDAEPINIQFTNAPASNVLTFVAGAVGVTLQIAPDADVSRPINITFTNAKAADVFTFVLNAANLEYTMVDESTILITAKRP